MQFKRFSALLLALMLLVSVLPVSFASQAQPEEDIWAQISALEDATLAQNAKRSKAAATAAEFAAMSEDVERLVVSSGKCEPGSIIRHGSFFYWTTTDGEVCGYSPRLRAKMHAESVNPAADDSGEIETVSYATRGGSAGGVNVAVFQPYYGLDSSFSTQYPNEGKRIASALGGTSTTYTKTAATVDQVAKALESCAVVIFDSHGDTDYDAGNDLDYVSRANTSYLCMQTNAGWTAEDQKAVTGTYGTYYHAYNAGNYGSMKYYCVDGTVFANHMTQSGCNNFLWMAICLGMATDGLEKPIHEKGVEVVYGYSQSVTFDGDYTYEEYFWDHMIDGYTAGESAAYMKTKANCSWDPGMNCSTITQAVKNYAAFPIMVSSEDVYPGKGKVDAVQTPNSTWTLKERFKLTATSNNTDWGTVSVSGTTITASPKTGYYAKDYTVTSGSATVTQNGNIFNVDAANDCSVQINFAAKTPATVSFITPDGVSASSISTYIGDEIALPAPGGKPTADAHEYRFLGWTKTALSDATDRPAYDAAGSKVTVSAAETTYYALYTYAVADGSATTGFEKLTAAPADWSGEYVLTYNGQVVLDASGKNTGAGLGAADAAIALADTGMVLSGSSLLDAKDDYIYEIAPSSSKSGAYTIKMKGSNNYIAYTGTTNSVTTTTSASEASAQWNLRFSGSTVSLQNATTTERYLQYNTTNKVFRCYKNSMKNLTLFAGVSGTTYYTTELTNAEVCKHDWGEPSYVWSEDNSQVTATRVCKLNDAHVETETVKTTSEVTLEATVDAEGEITYTAVFKNTAFETQTKTKTTPKLDKPDDPQPIENPFVDVNDGDWFKDAVLWAVSQSPAITSGTDATHFSPSKTCSRAEIVTFLWNAAGKPAPAADAANPFVDVKASDWYYNAVLWAKENKITSGTDATHFAPTRRCSRAEVVTFLWNAAGNPGNIQSGDNELPVDVQISFTDVKNGDWFYSAVVWAVENGITSGTTPTTFTPAKICTRAEVVQFLYKAS